MDILFYFFRVQGGLLAALRDGFWLFFQGLGTMKYTLLFLPLQTYAPSKSLSFKS